MKSETPLPIPHFVVSSSRYIMIIPPKAICKITIAVSSAETGGTAPEST